MKNKWSSLIILSLAMPIMSVQADMYKWEDASGVHYSQEPPAQGDVKKIKTTQPSSSSGEQQSEAKRIEALLKKQEDEANAKKVTEQQNDQVKNAKQINCQRAKMHLETLQTEPPRARMVNAQGEAQRLTYEQWQGEITKTQKVITDNCN